MTHETTALALCEPPPEPRATHVPRVITLASGKGGVGKTHIAVNLALALSTFRHRVLLIDGDLGLANINVLTGITPDLNAGHLLDGEQPFDSVVFRLGDRLDLLPAGNALVRLAELDLPGQVRLLERLDLGRRPYDYVIIDAPAGIGANVRLTLSMAHEVLLIMCPEMTSLTDAYALVKVARNNGFERPFRVVVNQVRMAGQAREMFTSIEAAAQTFLGVPLTYAGFIYHDRVVERAARQQQPFLTCFPESPASRCIMALARHLAPTTDDTGTPSYGATGH